MLELPDLERSQVAQVERCYRAAEPEHSTFRRKAEEFYRLYRGFTDFRGRAKDARDRDEVIYEAQKQWGAELFIPFCYSTVETIVPRMVAMNPRMIVVPRNEQAYGSVKNMKIVVDAQQKQIDYPTTLQTIAKDGLIYSLGVGKTRWKFTTRMQTKIVPSMSNPEIFVETPPEKTSPSTTPSPSASTRSTSSGIRWPTRSTLASGSFTASGAHPPSSPGWCSRASGARRRTTRPARGSERSARGRGADQALRGVEPAPRRGGLRQHAI
jgi:hypothetical protein